MIVTTHMPLSIRLIVLSILRTVSLAYLTPSCVPGSLSTVGSLKNSAATLSTLFVSCTWIWYEAGSGLIGRFCTMRSPKRLRKMASAWSLEM